MIYCEPILGKKKGDVEEGLSRILKRSGDFEKLQSGKCKIEFIFQIFLVERNPGNLEFTPFPGMLWN
jgi:hypothetical protein